MHTKVQKVSLCLPFLNLFVRCFINNNRNEIEFYPIIKKPRRLTVSNEEKGLLHSASAGQFHEECGAGSFVRLHPHAAQQITFGK